MRVAVAMSGGVDSSTVAAWLVDKGYEVIGLTMHLWDHGGVPTQGSRTCCATEDTFDARRVAATLGIPFYVVNLEKIFRETVVAEFISAYACGQTPNPCVRCNQILKFEYLLHKARQLGASFLATGHYCRLEQDAEGYPSLFRGADYRKDQSYFLFATSVEQLRYLRFPLGAFSKEETRQLAKKWRLHLAEKKESQDVCFVPDGNYKAFFNRQGIDLQPGSIVDLAGNTLGRHQGLGLYTIGQRKGLGIAHPHPLYVVAIQPQENLLVVGPQAALFSDSLELHDLNWLGSTPLKDPIHLTVKIRYAGEPVAALVTPVDGENRAHLRFEQKQRAITPGQACVFYQGERLMGGGWICG